MILSTKNLSAVLMLFLFSAFMTSCEKDESLTQVNQRNSSSNTTSKLMGRSGDPNSQNDSVCFALVYPVQINFPDGSNASVNSDGELEAAVEAWYTAQGEDAEDPTFEFPVSVTLGDGTQQTLQNEDELEDLFLECFDYDDWDDECPGGGHYEECFTFVFPLELNFSDGSQVTANNEDELFEAIDNWFEAQGEDADDPTLTYPVTVTLEDGTTQTANNEDELDELYELCGGDDFGNFTACFTFSFPFNVVQNGNTIAINDEAALEALFEGGGDFELAFPMTVTLDNGSTATVNSEEELDELCDD